MIETILKNPWLVFAVLGNASGALSEERDLLRAVFIVCLALAIALLYHEWASR